MIRKESMTCLGSLSLDHATITEKQRNRLKRAAEGLASLRNLSCPVQMLKMHNRRQVFE